MLWIALHLPLLSLEAWRASLPPAPGAAERPLALLDGHRVAAVDAVAAARGVRPGLKRATALALCPDLLAGVADAARDAAALQAVAHAALAFTPMVALQGPATVLAEVQSSLRCFGGARALQQRLQRAVEPLGHRVQWAAASTPLGAALLSQWRDGALEGPHVADRAALQRLLDGAPVWLLGPGRVHWEALQGMGLSTLGDLRALPRAGLARRFGDGLLDDLDRALGRLADPRRPLALPPAFDARLELFARADTTAQVLHGADVLLARLVAWAQAQQGRIAAFALHMRHEKRRDAPPATVLNVELAEPALDPAHLQLLLRERLARMTLAAPTLELALHCTALVRAPAPNAELFPTRQSQAEGLTRLLERLRARLGDDHVQRLLPVRDHRPERASRGEPLRRALVPGPAGAGASPAAALPLHRPVWLLDEPAPLAADRAGLPLLQGRPLRLACGPERIESGWWDGALAARDYFIAQDADGALVWIYRARLPPGPAEPPDAAGWFLHGRFG